MHQTVISRTGTKLATWGRERMSPRLQNKFCHPFNFLYLTFNLCTHRIIKLHEHNFKKKMIKVLTQQCPFYHTFYPKDFSIRVYGQKPWKRVPHPCVRWSLHPTPFSYFFHQARTIGGWGPSPPPPHTFSRSNHFW